MRTTRFLLAVAACLSPAQAGVIVVNGDAAVLQAAIDAAADGDTLLLKPPGGDVFFNTVTVDGKSLTLVADGGVYELPRLVVQNLPAGGQGASSAHLADCTIAGAANAGLSLAPPRGLHVSSPLRIGQAGTLEIEGVAGELAAVFEAGSLSIPFDTPPLLPPGVLGQTVLLQLFVKLGLLVTVEDVARCTLLDASIP